MQWKLLVERTKNNISKKKMSELLNITPESYSMKERDKLQFKADEMFLISDFFNKPLDEIFLPRNFDNIEKID